MHAGDRIVGVLVLAALLSVTLPAQSPPAVTGSVTVVGRVVAAESGEGLPNARIAVAGIATATRADLEGRFTITVPRAATLLVTKAGFVNVEQSLTTDPQLRRASLDIRLTRSAAISGRVTDEYGDPVVGVLVWAATAENTDKPPSASPRASTDDHGDYRIGGLPPGTYLVSVQTIGVPDWGAPVVRTINDRAVGTARVYSTTAASYRTYFPDTLDASMASPVTLRAGDERPDLDVHVRAGRSGGQSYSVIPNIVTLKDTTIPSDGDSTIRGSVVSADGRRLPHAEVVLHNEADSTFRVGATDADGAYGFSGLRAGTYRVVAGKPGFSLPSNASTLSNYARPGIAVTIGDKEDRGRIDITLLPWGAISGHVFDEAGEPMAGARVGLLVTRYEAGRRRLVPASTPQRFTDDRGEFRIYAIPGGEYVMAAAVADTPASRLGGYGPTFFPGTGSAAEARMIAVAAGDDSKGLDFSLVNAPTVRITGKLVDATGRPTTGGRFTLMPRSGLATRIDARIGPDGMFEFANVPPGQYVIQADRGRLSGAREGEFGAFPILVGRSDVTDLALQTSAGTTISGRVIYETVSGATPPRPPAISISAIPADFDLAPPSLAVAEPDANGAFTLAGITGERRLEVTKMPPGLMLKAIVANGRDVTDELLTFGRANSVDAVEVILTDRVNEVRGRVTDDRQRAISGAYVVVFSADRTHWYPASRFVRSTQAGADGTFSVTGLPTGSYFVAAALMTPTGDDAWRDPAFLDSLEPLAAAVSVSEGQALNLNLRVSSR